MACRLSAGAIVSPLGLLSNLGWSCNAS